MAVPTETRGNPVIYGTTIYTVFTKRVADGSLWQACIARVAHRAAAQHFDTSVLHGDGTNTVATTGAMELDRGVQAPDRGEGYRDHRPSWRCRRTCPCRSPHEIDMILLPQGLNALKQVATQVGADLRGASRNFDGGGDAARHRHGMLHAGLIPNITESPRKRKTTKHGCKRRFDAAIHALRMRVERTLAWEDTCRRLWRRFERLQRRHAGMTWLA